MTTLNSGLHFLSGIAVHFGSAPIWNKAKPSARKVRRHQKVGDYHHTPLTERQKKELLDTIRHDDWHE